MNQAARPLQQKEQLWTKDFILITLISLFTFVGFQMLLPTLPVYAIKLGGSAAHAGLVIGIFTFAAVLIRPFTGYAIDVYGRRGFFFTGMLIFMACVLAYIWAPTLLILLLLRFIHGFGWGITSTTASTVAADIIPKPRMGEGMGYYGLAGTLAMALAPALGLFIIQGYSFDILFLISASMVVISIILAFFIKYQKINQKNAKIEYKFTLIEKAALRPSIVIFFVTMTYGAIVSFLALHTAQLGISNIGSFFTVYAIALAISRPISGRLADKRGFDSVVIPGIILIIIGMFLLYSASNLQWFLIAGVVYGAGFGAVQPSLQALAIVDTPPERRGSANATFFTGFDLGLGLGAIVWGIIAQTFGYSIMYFCAILPAIIALILYKTVKIST
ncbi:MAG TPA: MFS transporter [Syntrophomonadaceae bacterium]|nr:MFS transporter [Syntrophomonadaceae bacterium]